MKQFVVVAAACAVLSCGKTQESQSNLNIIGGQEATETDTISKHTVALLSADGQGACTASIITRMHLLTAAHCIYAFKAPFQVVFSGSLHNELSRDDVRFGMISAVPKVSEIIEKEMAEGKDPDNIGTVERADIAVVVLNKPIPASYSPIQVLKEGENIPLGLEIDFAGYGLTVNEKVAPTEPSTQPSPENFTAEESAPLEVPVADEKPTSGILHVLYGGTFGDVLPNVNILMLLNKPNRQAGVCQGDSGGPAFVRVPVPFAPENTPHQLVQVGVNSAADKPCGRTNFATDTRKYSKWITDAVNKTKEAFLELIKSGEKTPKESLIRM